MTKKQKIVSSGLAVLGLFIIYDHLPKKKIRTRCTLPDIMWLTWDDLKKDFPKVSLYKLFVRPLFFYLTDGDTAHHFVMSVGKAIIRLNKVFDPMTFKPTKEKK